VSTFFIVARLRLFRLPNSWVLWPGIRCQRRRGQRERPRRMRPLLLARDNRHRLRVGDTITKVQRWVLEGSFAVTMVVDHQALLMLIENVSRSRTCSVRPWRPTSPALRWTGRSRAPPLSRPCCACGAGGDTSARSCATCSVGIARCSKAGP